MSSTDRIRYIVVEKTFRGHEENINSVCFSPDQTKLVSVGKDGKICIWRNQQTSKVLEEEICYGNPVTTCDYSPRGNLISYASVKSVVFFNPYTHQNICGNIRLNGRVKIVRFNRSGQTLLMGTGKLIRFWDVGKEKLMSGNKGNNRVNRETVLSLDILPDECTILSGCGNSVKLWDNRQGKDNCLRTFHNHIGDVLSVHFHPNSNYFGTGSADKTINIYDIRTGRAIQNYREHSGQVNEVFFHPSGNYLISGSTDKTIRIFSPLKGDSIFTLQEHRESVNSVKFSPYGNFFASGGEDEQVLLWKTNDFCDKQRMHECDYEGRINFLKNSEEDVFCIRMGYGRHEVNVFSKILFCL